MNEEKHRMLRKHALNAAVILCIFLIVFSLIGAFLGTDRAHALFSSIWFSPVWILTAVSAAAAVFSTDRSWNRLFLILIHISVILIITGSVTASRTGRSIAAHLGMTVKLPSGGMWLSEGQTSDSLVSPAGKITLPFSIRLDRFEIEYYEKSQASRVRDYLSHVSVIENAETVKTSVIEVNRPLHWGGYHFYQSSWREGSPSSTYLKAVSDSGWFLQVRPGLILLICSVFGFSTMRLRQLSISKATRFTVPPPELPKTVSRIIQILSGTAFILFPLFIILSGKSFEPVQYIFITALWILSSALFFYGRDMRGAGGAAYGLAFTLILTAFIYRWASAGQVPLQHMFEIMLTINMLFLPIHLIMRKYLSARIEWYDILTHIAFLIPAAFLFSVEVRPLPPALQSIYFIPHVFVYLLSYALMAKGCLLAAASLKHSDNNREYSEILSARVYGTILAGYPFLTCGLILGALWAKTAWGDYWGWDPKELWSLVTWLAYTIYLHKKSGENTSPRILNIIAILGFIAVIITLTWVNLSRLFTGLHNYA